VPSLAKAQIPRNWSDFSLIFTFCDLRPAIDSTDTAKIRVTDPFGTHFLRVTGKFPGSWPKSVAAISASSAHALGLINMQPMETHTPIVSIETAVAVTDRSRSTWWRHLSEGKVTRVADDARGRAMLAWADVASEVAVPMDADQLALVLRADAGDAEAQNELGQIFLSAEKFKSAFHWLRQAAGKNNADAMQWLAHCYVSGYGVPKDDNLCMMWLAKAAAQGHVIAQAQMDGLLQR
jgi:TPR repeat protein